MRAVLFLLLFLFVSCGHSDKEVSPQAISSCTKIKKKNITIHSGQHYYDGNLHLVPTFKSQSEQIGYEVAFIKTEFVYNEAGLQWGDIITHVDQNPVNQSIDLVGEYFIKIKRKAHKSFKVQRCNKTLTIKNLLKD